MAIGMVKLLETFREDPGTLQGYLARYQFKLFRGNYGGLNSLDAPDNIPQGEGENQSVESPDIMDVYSYPLGSITSFFNSAAINGTAITSAPAIQGLPYLSQISQALGIVAGGKFYEDVSGTATDRTGSVTITSGANNLADWCMVANLAAFTNRQGDAAWKWTGAGANIAALGGTPPTPVYYCCAFDRRLWLFDNSKGYYSAQDNAESGWDTVNRMLPFETNDGSINTSITVVGDSIFVGKEGPNANKGHIFRIFRSGDPAIPYDFEEVPTGGVGPISQQGTRTVNQDLIFLGKDGNFYMIRGNRFVQGGIGKNIKPYILTNFEKSRFQYCTSGIIRERNMLGFSFTTTGGTTHNRAFWYDYQNSAPGVRDLWYLSDHTICNVWGERVASGQYQLVTGDYAGFYHQHLKGSNFSGTAFSARRVTPWHHLGSPFTVKNIIALYVTQNVLGAFALTVEYRTDFSQNWRTARTISVTGQDVLGPATPSFILDTSVLGGRNAFESIVVILTRARRIQFRFSAGSANPFNLYSYGIIYDPMAIRMVL